MLLKICTLLFVICSGAALQAETFQFSVERARMLRNQRGQLEINESGVTFRSEDAKTNIRLMYPDIREADVSDRRVIRFELYDHARYRPLSHKTYVFKLLGATHDENLTRFLAEKLKRPVVGTYAGRSRPLFTMPAFHRHRLGGCHGTIQIGPDGIRFISEKLSDSRTWLYRDIETIGSADPFHFRVSSFAETYNFELKDRLSEEAYELAWQQLYRSSDGFQWRQDKAASRGEINAKKSQSYPTEPAPQPERRRL
ncbi:MAG: hypothetical protein ACRD7E_06830 [Bryobacteraceae bacterium]